MKALSIADNLRKQGQIVEMSLFDTAEETKEYCREKGISKIIIVDDNIKEAE